MQGRRERRERGGGGDGLGIRSFGRGFGDSERVGVYERNVWYPMARRGKQEASKIDCGCL